MKQTAGTLLYRYGEGQLEVLLVHPSGNYNRNAPWSIPKGMPDDGEELEAAARRETLEETGIVVEGELYSLGHIDYKKSRKRVHCFAGQLPKNSTPSCASWEIDRAEIVPLDQSRTLIHPDLEPFLDRLEEMLDSQD